MKWWNVRELIRGFKRLHALARKYGFALCLMMTGRLKARNEVVMAASDERKRAVKRYRMGHQYLGFKCYLHPYNSQR